MSNAILWPFHRLWIWLWGFAIISVSYWGAWLLRFEFAIPASESIRFTHGWLIVLAAKGVVLCAMQPRLIRCTRYTGFRDLVRLLQENVIASVLAGAALYAVYGGQFSRAVLCLDLMICILAGSGVLFAARLIYETQLAHSANGNGCGLLVYGAGVAGLALAREIRSNPKLGYRLIGFLDDDPRKQGATLLGFPVLGSGEQARAIVDAYRRHKPPIQEIVVAMPSTARRQVHAAVARGRAAGVPCRIVPGLGELISGKLHVDHRCEISVADLLGRERVNLEQDNVRRAIQGKVVLVTGAAGSIGSELCHQLAEFGPELLVVLDQAESEMFRLDAELRERHPLLHFASEIADIRNRRRVEEILTHHEVEAIFHAAAYKHVPVMEHQVGEAVRNNVIGTWNLVQAAWRLNVPRFLLISTDKAVNPSSVMGLTKRIAELIVSAGRPPVGRGPNTCFVCVRFGNVLVSNGSVVPIFQKQIARGGPVTVTHPDIRRYFMTVQEAVQLVLEASTLGKGSEIFVLDMGRPVRVTDLARRMIKQAGLVPEEDIEIRYVGLRPGEKLFEEISLDSENHLPTSNPTIRVFQGRRLEFAELVPWIAELQHLLWYGDAGAIISQLRLLVPEYQPAHLTPDLEPQPSLEAHPHVAAAQPAGEYRMVS
ncbi:MAG: polysaccharide biosynthesis protein [Acidobacteria bacterium]|nr:polysaccharide biosynthesis protein [Acidobacteriota bacterium]